MCIARAALVYGLTVRSASLVFAANAWTRLKRSTPFFDLVFLRRCNGGLTTDRGVANGPVTKVPNEVWEEIRHWLIQEELVDSELNYLQFVNCTNEDCQVQPAARHGVGWEFLKDARVCDACDEGDFGDFVRGTVAGWSGSYQAVGDDSRQPMLHSLLSDFGLALPSNQPILVNTDTYTDCHALALISARTQAKGGSPLTSEITANCGGDSRPDEHTIVDVSFKLPIGIDQRFTRFIKMFDLEVVDSAANEISFSTNRSVKAKIEKSSSTRSAQTTEVGEKVVKSIKPRWKLWTICESQCLQDILGHKRALTISSVTTTSITSLDKLDPFKMCSSETTLVYGLTVRSADLVFAADAWTRLQHSFHFFDLVFLRLSNGGLIANGDISNGAVTKFSKGIWGEVRKWLIKEEIADSEDNLLGPYLCDDPTCPLRPPPSQRMSWLRLRDMYGEECSNCDRDLTGFVRETMRDWDEPVATKIDALLSNFGLAAPSHSAVLDNYGIFGEEEYSALALVGAPSRFTQGGRDEGAQALVSADCGNSIGPDEHKIVDISFDGLPTDIDERFERLINTFNLEVVDSSINHISPRIGKLNSASNGLTHGIEARVTKEIKPSWKLYLLCRTVW